MMFYQEIFKAVDISYWLALKVLEGSQEHIDSTVLENYGQFL